MHLILHIDNIQFKVWPLTMPKPDKSKTDEENFNLREKYVRMMVDIAKIENARSLTSSNHYFTIEVKASVQPRDLCEEAPPEMPVVKFVRPEAVYSNHSPLKIAK